VETKATLRDREKSRLKMHRNGLKERDGSILKQVLRVVLMLAMPF
jgi:hypothetical protein